VPVADVQKRGDAELQESSQDMMELYEWLAPNKEKQSHGSARV